ncbi:MAG: hypothetical protein ACI4P6_07010 [Candidatus Spyradosoma sp.]
MHRSKNALKYAAFSRRGIEGFPLEPRSADLASAESAGNTTAEGTMNEAERKTPTLNLKISAAFLNLLCDFSVIFAVFYENRDARENTAFPQQKHPFFEPREFCKKKRFSSANALTGIPCPRITPLFALPQKILQLPAVPVQKNLKGRKFASADFRGVPVRG